jgi:amidase
MKRLSRDHAMQDFDPTATPAITLEPGERIVVESHVGARPATGPIAIVGAQPGDTLVIDIHEIRITEAWWWWRAVEPNRFRQGVYRALGDHLASYPRTVHPRLGESVYLSIPIEDDVLVFSERVRVRMQPVIGCIGVAPAGAARPTNLGGSYGGNIDCREIAPGARLYLPVNAPGGLIGLCDVHGAQGDSELLPCAECAGDVTLSATVRPKWQLSTPLVETPTALHTVGYGQNVEDAVNDAAASMLSLLTGQSGLTHVEAAQLLGTCADLRVCQLVNAHVNLRLSLPKAVLPDGFSLGSH